MNTYRVYLRKGGVVSVTAAGYTESKRSERVYFFTDPARKDRQTWFNVRDLEGIHAAEVHSPPIQLPESYKRWQDEHPPAVAPTPEAHNADAETAI